MEEGTKQIDERINRKRKIFTRDTYKEIRNENSIKINDKIPRTTNLLNYFSKVTPEQIQKEKLIKAKVTVQAEVHTPQDAHVFMNSKLSDVSKKQKIQPKLKQYSEGFDEINVIQPKSVILSSNNQVQTSSQSKTKWSMKIQLEPNKITHSSHIEIDNDEIYIPMEKTMNNKKNDKIPKVLLPIKNKNKEYENTVLDMEQDVHKKKIQSNNEHYFKSANNLRQEREYCQINQDYSLKRKPQEKLAPLFVKKIKSSYEMLAARNLFLQSEITKKNVDKVHKLSFSGPKYLPFPKIGHINYFVSKNNNLKLSAFLFKSNQNFQLNINSSDMKTITNFNYSENYCQPLHKCKQTEINSMVSEMKLYCPDAEILRDYVSNVNKYEYSKDVFKIESKRNYFDSFHGNKNNHIQSDLWTNKYKPSNYSQIVGNEEAAIKLKTWLNNWNVLKNDPDDYSSSDEFCTSDCNSPTLLTINQVAVLIGPHGSGKTSCVYAIAQELGYNVLEVNASSRRPGKIILKEFEEATKSHGVKKSGSKDFYKSRKTLKNKNISENSLILLEDVDLVFEEDDGFVYATSQLASNTKRPIVMTLNGTCFHLSKLAPQQLRIDFQPVSGNRAIALLQLIALAEMRCKLNLNCLEVLYHTGDFRRCLLQLQYLTLSNKKNFPHSTSTVSHNNWHDMLINFYKPAVKAINKSTKHEKQQISKNILEKMIKSLENFSIVSELLDIQDPTCKELDSKFEPSLSFVQNTRSYFSLEILSLEIGNWMNETIKGYWSNNSKRNNSQIHHIFNQQFHIKKHLNEGINTTLSEIVSNTLDQKTLAIDYFSSIRTICRAEHIRNQLNSKRGNRFFHYFQNSKLSSVIKSSNLLSTACKPFQEKIESSVKT